MSARTTISVDTHHNSLLETVLETVNRDPEIKTLYHVLNTNAMKRLGMTDHGPVHFQIVAQTSLKLLRLLVKSGLKPSSVKDFGLSQDHAELIVLLASLLHDVGMSVNRKGHEEFSVVLTNTLLRQLLDFLPVEERVIVTSETLHAIISHRRDGTPITLEAGVIRVADALDMTKGRSRIPYREGKIDIHSVSAMAIDAIEIKAGRKIPVHIDIIMNHTAGIFQVDELLREKITGSGLEPYLDITVYMDKGKGRELFKNMFAKR